MAQSFKKIPSVSFSCNFKTKPVRSPLNPVGKKTIKVPFVSSRIARVKPMINQTFPEYRGFQLSFLTSLFTIPSRNSSSVPRALVISDGIKSVFV